MRLEKRFTYDDDRTGFGYKGFLDVPDTCPICHYAICPTELHIDSYMDANGAPYAAGLFLCRHCYQVFTVLYKCELHIAQHTLSRTSNTFSSMIMYAEPTRYAKEVFDPMIQQISPMFVEIYNQALAAESHGLSEIAGLGYRKALEFLVKDFCIHCSPEDCESIQKEPLGACINGRIEDKKIKILASRATWIGNDEAHYIRKHEERDIGDMKKFIKAMLYSISAELAFEDAESINRE